MLVEAMALLLAGLNQHIQRVDGNVIGSTDAAIWGNAAQIDHPDIGTTLENQLVVTLVNLEEEATLKNGQIAFRQNASVEYRHRPVHMNLFLLFAANYANYQTALQRIDQVVTFFQSHKHFDLSSNPAAVTTLGPETELAVTMELVSLNLEEINNLWGALGGKQLPSVTFRGRVIAFEEDRARSAGGPILETVIDAKDTVAARGGER